MQAELGRVRRDIERASAVTMPTSSPRTLQVARKPDSGRFRSARSWLRWSWRRRGLLVFLPAHADGHAHAKDTVLLADFVNSTGDPVFDDALRGAVSVQLQQTPFLTLLPDQRIQRTLRMMQQPPDTAVTAAVAREVCQRAGRAGHQ
jgi:hypothetical protein